MISAPLSWWKERIIQRAKTAVKNLRGPKPAKAKKAAAYLLDDCMIIYSSSSTTMGLDIASPPYLRVAKTDSAEIGNAALQALNASLENVRHPASWDHFFDPAAHAAGVKSWRAFAKAAKGGVYLVMEGDTVILTPMKNLGPKEGFSGLPEKARSTERAPGKLGPAIIAALEDVKADPAGPRKGIN